MWNVLTGECQVSFRFPGAILAVQFNPRDENKILVCPLKAPPLVVGIVLQNTNSHNPVHKGHVCSDFLTRLFQRIIFTLGFDN